MRKPIFIAISISIVAMLVAPATAGGGKNTNNLTQEQLFELQLFSDWIRTRQNIPQQLPIVIPPKEQAPLPPPPDGPVEGQQKPE